MKHKGGRKKSRSSSQRNRSPVDAIIKYVRCYWSASIWHKFIITALLLLGLIIGGMYGIARWYIWSEQSKPLELGASFSPGYATALGLDPHQTLQAMLHDLGIKHLRLMSHWSDIEPQRGTYNFSELDYEFQVANASHTKVTLTLGLRQPRWPECHPPSWIDTSAPLSSWQPALEQYIQTVVNRYKNNSALESYQLENEYFLKVFGKCTDFSRERLISEFNLVKKLDPTHPIIIARSNNALGTPLGQPIPDKFGVSIYKRVWDQTITHRYLEYPFPAWFYGFLAGTEKILWGKDTVIHELQAEPWPPRNVFVSQASINEQNKSMNAKILQTRIRYGEGTGMRSIYLWGAEWWYWRLVTAHDPSLWNVAKQAYQASN